MQIIFIDYFTLWRIDYCRSGPWTFVIAHWARPYIKRNEGKNQILIVLFYSNTMPTSIKSWVGLWFRDINVCTTKRFHIALQSFQPYHKNMVFNPEKICHFDPTMNAPSNDAFVFRYHLGKSFCKSVFEVEWASSFNAWNMRPLCAL